MSVSHLFFGLHGTLVDSQRVQAAYPLEVGKVLAARYGDSAEHWTQAYRLLLADWDSYFADLNLDEDISDLWEGEFRITRALFRLTGTPEPDHAELQRLSRELPEQAAQGQDTLYPDCKNVLHTLYAAGYTLGLCSGSLTARSRGLLRGGGVLAWFRGPLVGPDTAGHFRPDALIRAAVQQAPVSPAQCMLVDHQAEMLAAAQEAGMTALHLQRPASALHALLDHLKVNTHD